MPTGAAFPALVNAVLERDAAGAPIVIRVAVFDATERREYERELLRAKQQAEESDRHSRLLARTLQQSLIPPALPPIPGIDIAAAYRPAGSGDEVGGDFYDVFEVGDGDWVVVIGDVCGKGAEAAVVTALARYTIRAAAATVTSRPSEILETLNEALLRHGSGRFCTVASARLSTRNGTWQRDALLRRASPPAARTRPGPRPRQWACTARSSACSTRRSFTTHELALRPGDQLVFFTDGVTEGRRGRDFYGDERLQAAAAGPGPPREEPSWTASSTTSCSSRTVYPLTTSRSSACVGAKSTIDIRTAAIPAHHEESSTCQSCRKKAFVGL